MLTVVMECCNQEAELAKTLTGLVSAAVEGLVSDVMILDRGSTDGSARVADAAGCRFHESGTLHDALETLRGEWLLLIEPGARLQQGWIEEVMEYMTLNREPAKFSLMRRYRRHWLQRIVSRPPPLEQGLLLRKQQAQTAARPGTDLSTCAGHWKSITLRSEIVPARVARAAASL